VTAPVARTLSLAVRSHTANLALRKLRSRRTDTRCVLAPRQLVQLRPLCLALSAGVLSLAGRFWTLSCFEFNPFHRCLSAVQPRARPRPLLLNSDCGPHASFEAPLQVTTPRGSSAMRLVPAMTNIHKLRWGVTLLARFWTARLNEMQRFRMGTAGATWVLPTPPTPPTQWRRRCHQRRSSCQGRPAQQ
jgi:hypothetical protein